MHIILNAALVVSLVSMGCEKDVVQENKAIPGCQVKRISLRLKKEKIAYIVIVQKKMRYSKCNTLGY